MKQPKKIRLAVICLLWIGISVFGFSGVQVKAEEKESIENAKAGIVGIFSGFYDTKGEFRNLKSGSGFLVRNNENETYIITNRSVVTVEDRDKKEYCKENKIKLEGDVPETVRKIIVKGDVSVEAELVVESIEKDFCILSTENVVNEKTALKLEDISMPKADDVIYVLGFPNEGSSEYDPKEVECSLGMVAETKLNWNDIIHIQHTAHLSDGCVGGPLLNETGYVVGISSKKILEDGREIFCALPILEIKEVLDNFSIHYESSLREQWNTELEQLYVESTALCESKNHKKESLEELQLVLTDIDKLKEKPAEEVEIAEIEQAYRRLEEVKNALVPKMEKIQLAIYIMAGVIALLFIWVVVLLILKMRDRKKGVQADGGINSNSVHRADSGKNPQQTEQNLQHQGQNPQKQVPSEQNASQARKNIYKKDRTVQSLSLINQRTGQAKEISDKEIIVGRSRQKTDFSIPDNTMIGRTHATFRQENGKYYICDLDSKNGTFINGRKIDKNIYEEIKAGDEIILADEKFELR